MELATRLGLRNPAEFAPLWVVDFPLLELDEESGRWHAMHHLLLKTRRHGFVG
jgi:aspartyl-tRNA synthetase